MRDFQGLNAAAVPDKIDGVEDYLPILQRDLGTLDYFLRDLSRGIARIQKGEVPDGSGDPIPFEDDGEFFKLPGRPNNQDAHGGTLAGGSLTLSSTAHSTRGLIYFGDAKTSVYDETNDRFGVNATAPAAKLQLNTNTPAQHLRVSALGANGSNSGWVDQLGSSVNADLINALDETVASDADYVTHQMNGGLFKFHITSGTDPGVNTGYVMRFRAKASSLGVGGKLRCALSQGTTTIKEIVIGTDATTPTATELPLAFTTFEFTIDAADILAARPIDFTNLYLSWQNGQGVDAGQFIFVSWAELELPGATSEPLQRWSQNTTDYLNDLSWALDGNGATVLAFTGTPKLAFQNTGLEFTIGSPASGKFWTATDTVGTGQWSTVTANSFPLNVVSVSANYTALTTDNVILCTGTFTVTLYTAVGNTGKRLFIKNVGTGAITVDGDGTETIDGNLTLGVGMQYNDMAIVSDGSNWAIL